MKNGAEVTLKISLNVVGYSNNENNFLHKLSLTNTQISKVCKAAKTHKIRKSGGFLDIPLWTLQKNGLSLVKSVLKPLAKRVLTPLGLAAAASAADAAVHKKYLDLVQQH